MNEIVSALRKEAARILQENIVDVVIGFESGTLPIKSRPVLIRRPEAAGSLVLNGLCRSNLAAYLHGRPARERIGIVCRGCESRAVRALVIEQQCSREHLYVIGVPCAGILDEPRILAAAGEDILWIREEGDLVVVSNASGRLGLDRATLLHESCRNCRSTDPVGADILIAVPAAPKQTPAAPTRADAIGALDADARYDFFAAETQRCIRCYACREACPMCYCTRCFVDQNRPRWIESSVSAAGIQAWHIIRAFHQTGRCVACGACERACPMQIRMTYLTDKLNQDVAQTYGFEAGVDDQRQPPFASFGMDDAGRFEG